MHDKIFVSFADYINHKFKNIYVENITLSIYPTARESTVTLN